MVQQRSYARELLIVDLMIVLYALCYQLQSPLEPYLVDRLLKSDGGGDGSREEAAASYAKLQSFFSFVQILGSLAVGYLLDKLGIRFMFALNFIACAASFGILAVAGSVRDLYLSKLPTLFMAGFLCAQTAVAKLTRPGPDRVAQLGRLTMAYTIGGTVGPALGGRLGTYVAARVAVAGCALAAALVLLLPSQVDASDAPFSKDDDSAAKPPTPAAKPHAGVHEAGGASLDGASAAVAASAAPWRARAAAVVGTTWPLLVTKLCSAVVNSSMGAVRPLVLKNDFGLTEAELGVVMSTIFFGTAVVSLGLGALSRLAGTEANLVAVCLAAMTAGFAAQAALFHQSLPLLAPALAKPVFVALAFLLALFQFPMATALTSLSTGRVPAPHKGTLMGIEHAIFALAGLVGPHLGQRVHARAGVSGVAALGAVTFAGLRLFWAARRPAARSVEK